MNFFFFLTGDRCIRCDAR